MKITKKVASSIVASFILSGSTLLSAHANDGVSKETAPSSDGGSISFTQLTVPNSIMGAADDSLSFTEPASSTSTLTITLPNAQPVSYSVKSSNGSTAVESHEGGALTIRNTKGQWLGGSTELVAVDASGSVVPVSVTAAGDALSVSAASSQPVSYPVKATATFGWKFFDWGKWIRYGEPWGPTFSLHPNALGHRAYPWDRGESWEEAKRMGSSGTNSMANQYFCHFDVVAFTNKAEWNLDSGRPDVGYWRTVQARCNPGGGD